MSGRMERERKTVSRMVAIYCRKVHKGDNEELCQSCMKLHEYAMKRLAACPFQEGKTTCGKCHVHCYSGEMKERIRQVMRVSGPLMMWRHPFLAFMHFMDGLRKKASSKRRSL